MITEPKIKLCVSCGNPTGRSHPMAKYCWPCMQESNTKTSRESHKKSNAKRKEKQNIENN